MIKKPKSSGPETPEPKNLSTNLIMFKLQTDPGKPNSKAMFVSQTCFFEKVKSRLVIIRRRVCFCWYWTLKTVALKSESFCSGPKLVRETFLNVFCDPEPEAKNTG